MNRCSNFPLISAPRSLFSIWTDLKRSEKSLGTNVEVRRIDLANLVLRTSPKFTKGVKYQLHQSFLYQIRDPEIPITLRFEQTTKILNIASYIKREDGQLRKHYLIFILSPAYDMFKNCNMRVLQFSLRIKFIVKKNQSGLSRIKDFGRFSLAMNDSFQYHITNEIKSWNGIVKLGIIIQRKTTPGLFVQYRRQKKEVENMNQNRGMERVEKNIQQRSSRIFYLDKSFSF